MIPHRRQAIVYNRRDFIVAEIQQIQRLKWNEIRTSRCHDSFKWAITLVVQHLFNWGRGAAKKIKWFLSSSIM